MKYSKNGQNFVTTKNTKNVLIATCCAKKRTSVDGLVQDKLFLNDPFHIMINVVFIFNV